MSSAGGTRGPVQDTLTAWRFARRTIFVGCIVGTVVINACSTMPTVWPQAPLREQPLASVMHWQLIDREVAVDLENERILPEAGNCVVVGGEPYASESPFQRFVVHDFPSQLSLWDMKITAYRNQQANAGGCWVLRVDASVVQHSGPAARPPPGKYTILAQGLVVVRNVARAFHPELGVGVVAGAEAAWWLSAGLRGPAYTTEVVVTAALSDADGAIHWSRTYTYYIDSGEADLYEPPLPVKTAQARKRRHCKSKCYVTRLPAMAECESGIRGAFRPAACYPARTFTFRSLEVSPFIIFSCNASAKLTIMGRDLARRPEDYQLDQVSGTKFLVAPAQGSTTVEFDGLKFPPPKQSQYVRLTMSGSRSPADVDLVLAACAPAPKAPVKPAGEGARLPWGGF